MPKVPLNTITSGYGTVDALNQNFDAIEAAFDNTLSRDGDTPNQMQANLDMNGFSILNQANPYVVDGLNWRGNWATATTYALGDIVQTNGIAYICIVAHTSGVFATDLAAVRWQVFVQTNLPTQTGNSGRYLSTDGSLASWQPIVVPDGSVTTAKLADGVLSADVAGRAKMADGFVTPAKLSTGAPTWDVSNNLGVGVSTPSYRAHIANSATNALGVFRDLDVVTAGNTGTNIDLGARNGATFTPGAQITGVLGNPATVGSISISTRSSNTLTERMRIASDGQQSSVIPGGSVLYPEYKCRAWANFDGTGTVGLRGSGNVSSITDNGVGDYTVNFTTSMPDMFYAKSIICQGITGNNQVMTLPDFGPSGALSAPTASSFRFMVVAPGTGFVDSGVCNVSIFR